MQLQQLVVLGLGQARDAVPHRARTVDGERSGRLEQLLDLVACLIQGDAATLELVEVGSAEGRAGSFERHGCLRAGWVEISTARVAGA